jgi:DNA-binding transcriptional ArsR family regulator
MSKQSPEHDDMNDKLVDAANVLRALGHPARLDIVISLESYEMTVGTLAMVLETNENVISKNLKILLDAGIVTMRRDGRTHYYKLKDAKYANILTQLIADRL